MLLAGLTVAAAAAAVKRYCWTTGVAAAAPGRTELPDVWAWVVGSVSVVAGSRERREGNHGLTSPEIGSGRPQA